MKKPVTRIKLNKKGLQFAPLNPTHSLRLRDSPHPFGSTTVYGNQISSPGRMGRKAGSMYINPKRFGSLQKPCLKETITFLNCMALNNCKDENCERQKKLLTECMDAQVGKNRKPWGSMNYHLQRLNKSRK